jgi:ribosome-binding factor A
MPARAAKWFDGEDAGGAERGEETDGKTLGVCAQARRAIEFALGVECRDPVLTELRVMAVTPEPTVRRLRVWLLAPWGAEESLRADALDRLSAARGFLRAHVAAGIHRKRTPELVFELVPTSASVGEVER